MSGAAWWQRAVIYQIYPRSFADGDGSGVGDLAGITERLDHLTWLGVDALWLSPIFPSPMYDFGYDVADYCDVDPTYGDLATFDRLLEAAHARDLKVMLDWVPAHTSILHPWFVEARASRDSARRDWYVWRDGKPDGSLPNNWMAAFKKLPAWTLDEATGQYYLHSFLPEQPDLNWNNPEVVEAMHATLRFWLDRGVDGFRADVVHNIGKPDALRDVEPAMAPIPHCALNDEALTHEHLRAIRALLDEYAGERAMVGEVFLLQTEQVAAYYGSASAPELHMSFNFPPLFAPWTAEDWRAQIEKTSAVLDPIGAWPTWVLSNHDQKRHRTRYGSEARARAAALLLLTLRGTPFLYMGEELGLEDAVVPEERIVDPGGRDGCRAPIPWTAGPDHGWGPSPWLPFPPEAAARCVERQREDDSSMLHLYRRLLRARRASPALQTGSFAFRPAPAGVLAWERRQGADRRRVVIHFGDGAPGGAEGGAGCALPDFGDGWIVEVASDAGGGGPSPRGAEEGKLFRGRIEVDQALLLRPV